MDLWTCYLSKQTNSKVAFLEFLGPLFIQNTSEVIINWCFLRLSSALEEDLCGNERSSAWDHVPTWNAPVLYSICPWTRVSATSWFQSKVKVQMNWIVHGHLCLESESEPFGTIKSTICKPWRLNGSTCRKGLISCKLWPIQTNILSLWSIIHHQTGVEYRKSANIQYTLYVIHTCDLFRYFCFKFKKTYWRQ